METDIDTLSLEHIVQGVLFYVFYFGSVYLGHNSETNAFKHTFSVCQVL